MYKKKSIKQLTKDLGTNREFSLQMPRFNAVDDDEDDEIFSNPGY